MRCSTPSDSEFTSPTPAITALKPISTENTAVTVVSIVSMPA